jgi:ankyrin repeat protein
VLGIAIGCQDVETTKDILQLSSDMGMNISQDRFEDGVGYLHVASFEHNAELVRLLIENGASVTRADEMGMTPLHYACCSGSKDVIELLLKSGAEVDKKGGRPECTSLMVLLFYAGCWTSGGPRRSRGDVMQIVGLMIAKDASIHARDADGNTCLHYAMFPYDPDLIQTLLDLGANPGAASDDLLTPLHVLARRELAAGVIPHWAEEDWRVDESW